MRTLMLTHAAWTVDETQQLGRAGGFGAVFAGKGAAGESVAVKLLHKIDDNARELEFAKYFCGKPTRHIVPILDYGVDVASGRPCIVMTQAAYNLRAKLTEVRAFSESDCLSILIDLARGLTEAGSWVHRDLKPENSLFCDGRWHLADFGLARQSDAATATHTVRGGMTMPYAAPEQIDGSHTTNATDVYALGCVGAELLSGKLAFPGPDFARQHLTRMPQIENASPQLHTLLLEMMSKAPESRPTIAAVLPALELIRTPRAYSGDGGARLRSAATRQLDATARADAERVDRETRLEHRAQLSHAARIELEGIGARLFDTIPGFAPGASLRAPPTVSLPVHPFQQRQLPRQPHQPPPQQGLFVESLTPKFYAQFGHGYLALTSGMFGIVEGQFGKTWNVLIGDVIAVWQHNFVRSASLWYASVDGTKPRWYEVGYFNQSVSACYPTALRPGQEAVTPLNNDVTNTGWRLAYQPQEVAADAADQFIDRWLNLFADAVDEDLKAPASLPLLMT
jgi:serine/threonine protein kinase